MRITPSTRAPRARCAGRLQLLERGLADEATRQPSSGQPTVRGPAVARNAGNGPGLPARCSAPNRESRANHAPRQRRCPPPPLRSGTHHQESTRSARSPSGPGGGSRGTAPGLMEASPPETCTRSPASPGASPPEPCDRSRAREGGGEGVRAHRGAASWSEGSMPTKHEVGAPVGEAGCVGGSTSTVCRPSPRRARAGEAQGEDGADVAAAIRPYPGRPRRLRASATRAAFACRASVLVTPGGVGGRLLRLAVD